MALKDFILSDKWSDRVMRHLLFWAFWSFYFTMVRYWNPAIFIRTGHFGNLFEVALESVLTLIPQTILVYALIGFILPRFVFKGKYLCATLWFTFFLWLTFTATAFSI